MADGPWLSTHQAATAQLSMVELSCNPAFCEFKARDYPKIGTSRPEKRFLASGAAKTTLREAHLCS
eukprot:1305528-Amphidinium_carterae.1